MERTYFELQKQFILNITKDWKINADHFQVSVVSFENTAKLEINFDTSMNITDFHKKITNLKYIGETSNLTNGLQISKDILDGRNRWVSFTKVKKYLIVLSDGLAAPRINIHWINSSAIQTRIVAIGEDVSHYFLKMITGRIRDVFPFDAEQFGLQLRLELIHPMCTGKDSLSGRSDIKH